MPEGGNHFSSVKKAKAALKEKALETYNLLIHIIKQAAAAGDYETAAKYTAYLLDHTPDEDGERLFADSVDKRVQQLDTRPVGPTIQIGVNIGGTKRQELPEVIEIKPNDPS